MPSHAQASADQAAADAAAASSPRHGSAPRLQERPALPRPRAVLSLGLGLTLAFAMAFLASGSARAGISGPGASVLHASNLDPAEPADMVLELYRQGSAGAPDALERRAVAPGAAARFDLAMEDALSRGAFAARLSADRDAALLSRMGWPLTGGLALDGAVLPSTELVVPALRREDADRTSLLTIQNTDANVPAEARVEILPDAATEPLLDQRYTINPGTSITLDLARGVDFITLPPGFVGWARITSETPLAASVLLDYTSSQRAVASYAASPADRAAETLYAPLLYGYWSRASLRSVVTLLNPTETEQTAELLVRGIAGTCERMDVVLDLGRIPAGGLKEVGIPFEGCLAAGRLDASGPMLGLVFTHEAFDPAAGQTPDRAAAYRMPPAAEAAPRVALPYLRRGDPDEAGVQVMNTSPEETDLALRIFDDAGQELACDEGCELTLDPLGVHRFPPDLLPEGFAGSAMLEAEQPLAAASLDAFAPWDLAAYAGLPAQDPAPQRPLRYAPLVMNIGESLDPQTATPSPTPSPETSTTPTPDGSGTPSPSPTPTGTRTGTPTPDGASPTPTPTGGTRTGTPTPDGGRPTDLPGPEEHVLFLPVAHKS